MSFGIEGLKFKSHISFSRLSIKDGRASIVPGSGGCQRIVSADPLSPTSQSM